VTRELWFTGLRELPARRRVRWDWRLGGWLEQRVGADRWMYFHLWRWEGRAWRCEAVELVRGCPRPEALYWWLLREGGFKTPERCYHEWETA
jgi:hypothetical protein